MFSIECNSVDVQSRHLPNGIFQLGGTSPSSKTLQTPIEFPVEPPTIQPFGEIAICFVRIAMADMNIAVTFLSK